MTSKSIYFAGIPGVNTSRQADRNNNKFVKGTSIRMLKGCWRGKKLNMNIYVENICGNKELN